MCNLLTIKDRVLQAETFKDMFSCVRQVWIMDVGGCVETISNDPTLFIRIHPGVWEDNKLVLSWMKENTLWWEEHFTYHADGFYFFRE